MIMSKRMTPPTLLLISGTWPPLQCGVGDYSAQLGEHLSRVAVRVHVLTSRRVPPYFRLDGEIMMEVHPRIERWNHESLRVAQQLVEEVKPDIIHWQWPTAAYGRSLSVNWLPRFLKKMNPGIPVLTTLHEYRYFNAWTRWRLWPAFTASERIVVVDPLDLDEIRRSHPRTAKRCCFIPIASNLPAVPEQYDREWSRRQAGLRPEDFGVVFFGFTNPPKGLEVLLYALHHLRRKYPQLKLILLPRLSAKIEYHKKIQQLLRTLDLEAHTLQPDYALPVQAAEILAGGDCAVLPYVDGVSMKRGTFFACVKQGLPIVTTLPRISESFPFKNQEHILAVLPRNPWAVAEAVERLICNPKLRQRLSQAAHTASDSFSWEAIAQKHLQLYNEVWGGRH
ncbi:glycosyltransferase [candidate division FCPU426 bacterium]|nr:glycosyltransferase [candidate division FCPU426 bacterium]